MRPSEKGFDERNLRNMRQFFLTFPIRNAVRAESPEGPRFAISKEKSPIPTASFLRPELSLVVPIGRRAKESNECFRFFYLAPENPAIRDLLLSLIPGSTSACCLPSEASA